MRQGLDLSVSWEEYHHAIESLAEIVKQSDIRFDRVVCIARGGLRVGDILSRIFDLPLAIIVAKSYDGDRGRGNLQISSQIAMTGDRLGSNILLVDDLVDSGTTLKSVVAWLIKEHKIEPNAIKTAVIWYKACSIYIPDYYLIFLPDNPWIHQPFEKYDRR
jgi:uncharacterized protein